MVRPQWLVHRTCSQSGGNVIMEFLVVAPDRASLEKCIAEDPYTWGDVWRDVTIRPYRLVR
jgi:uncharacterized protein YciI